MTTGNVPVRSAYGRAGFKPRHRLTPLSPPTACACLAALWRADRPAQLPPYRVAVRAPNLCRAWLNLSRPPRTEPRGEEPREPRHRPTRLSPFTACAAPPAQSPPYGVDLRALCRVSLPTNHWSLVTEFLPATLPKARIELTHSQRTTYQNSTRNKFALSGNAPSARPPGQTNHKRKEVTGCQHKRQNSDARRRDARPQ